MMANIETRHREAAERAMVHAATGWALPTGFLTDAIECAAAALASAEQSAFAAGRASAADMVREHAATIQAFAGERSAELVAYLLELFAEGPGSGRASGGEWVAYGEKPKPGQLVLAFHPNATLGQRLRVGVYEAHLNDVLFSDGFWHLNESQATHWMPLPPPPVKQTEGGGR